MRFINFRRTIDLVDKQLRDVGFLKIKKDIYQSEHITLIFYFSQHSFKTRMYILDTITKRHLLTYFYDFNLPKACAREIRTNIQEILYSKYEQF